MGTNYYKKYPCKPEIKKALIELIEKEDFTIDNYGDVHLNTSWDLKLKPLMIHIGKRSAGWKFLFNANNWRYYRREEEDIKNWILEDDGSIIVDEYGEKYTPQEMLDIINETYDTPWRDGKERWDAISYNNEHPHQYNGINMEEYVGKYRVSLSDEFS